MTLSGMSMRGCSTAGQTRRMLSSAGSRPLVTWYFLLFPERIHKYAAFLEDGLAAMPLGGQYSVFALHG